MVFHLTSVSTRRPLKTGVAAVSASITGLSTASWSYMKRDSSMSRACPFVECVRRVVAGGGGVDDRPRMRTFLFVFYLREKHNKSTARVFFHLDRRIIACFDRLEAETQKGRKGSSKKT